MIFQLHGAAAIAQLFRDFPYFLPFSYLLSAVSPAISNYLFSLMVWTSEFQLYKFLPTVFGHNYGLWEVRSLRRDVRNKGHLGKILTRYRVSGGMFIHTGGSSFWLLLLGLDICLSAHWECKLALIAVPGRHVHSNTSQFCRRLKGIRRERGNWEKRNVWLDITIRKFNPVSM